MTKRIFTQLTLIVAVLALTAVCEEKPLSLADTKWYLEAFVDLETNEIREPDRSGSDLIPNINPKYRFTLEFSTEFSSDPVHPIELYALGNLATEIFYAVKGFKVDYTNSTIAFGEIVTLDAPLGGVPDEPKYYHALRGARTFELTDNSLKIYYLVNFINKETWEETWSDTVVGYLLFKPWTTSKVLDANRTVLQPKSDKDVTIALLPPEIILSPTNFTAGPNPISKSAALVNFYRVGKQVKTASLKIYDVSGKTINKISISDKSAVQNARSKRQVGSWNLKDAKGRPVSEGTYLVKGTVKTVDRKSEKISLLISVR